MIKLAAFLFASVLMATEVSGPIVGYAVDPEHRQVRVILGVPGSTHYSDAIAWPAEAASVRTTPGHRWLLVLRTDGLASAWIPEAGAELSLDGVRGEPGVIALSPSGSAAAFYWPDDQRLVVYAGLPSQAAAREIRSGAFTALAVNDRGDAVAALASSGELHLLTKDTDTLLREARPVTSFAFFGDPVAVVEAGSDQLEMLGAAGRSVVPLAAPVSEAARFTSVGLVDPQRAVLYRFTTAADVHAVALEGVAIAASESLRPRGATLLKAPDGDVPRIVLSHAAGDDVYYLPTLAVEEVQQ